MSTPDLVSRLIYSFHVPLFFIVSGYAMALGRQCSLGHFLARRWRTLIVPYLLFSLVAMAVLLLQLSREADRLPTLSNSLLGILFGNGAANPKTVLTPLWFLTCLFSTELLFRLMRGFSFGRNWLFHLLVLLLLAFGLWNSSAGRLILPWGAHIAPVGLFFYVIGYVCCKYRLVPNYLRLRWLLPGLALATTVWLGAALLNDGVDMNSNHYGQAPLFFASALSGAVMLFFVVLILQQNAGFAAIATYLGANSMVILATHTFWPSLSRQLFAWLASVMPQPLIPVFSSRLDMLLSVFLVWLSIEVINRWAPSWIGRTTSR
jgi:fucose 4-O-acetylase-like acetyltransferase